MWHSNLLQERVKFLFEFKKVWLKQNKPWNRGWGGSKGCGDSRQNGSPHKGGSDTCNKKGDDSRSLPPTGGVKRPHWYKPGTFALWEICHYQKSVELLIRILPFCHLVWEITQDVKSDLMFQANVLKALQEATEVFLVNLCKDANWCAIHTKHVMVMPKDFYLMQKHKGVCFNPMWK